MTRIAADDVRRATVPSDPNAYKIELPADFRAPEGIDFKFNESDPLLSQAKTLAHELGIPQEGLTKLLGLYAGAQVANASTVESARQAEMAKLGPNATARVDALQRLVSAEVGDQKFGEWFTSRLWTAQDVSNAERWLSKRAGGSSSSFTGSGREPPPAAGRKSDAEVAKMSPAQRLDYARQFSTPPQRRSA